jgi:hypothetical protein
MDHHDKIARPPSRDIWSTSLKVWSLEFGAKDGRIEDFILIFIFLSKLPACGR